jgi:hypothetical protein
MRTLITEEIDGYTIVKGVDRPAVDAVSTRMKVEEKIKNDPDKLELEKLASEAGKKLKEYLISKSKRKSRVVNGVRLNANEKIAQKRWDEFQAIVEKVKISRAKFDKKCLELFHADPQYFQPKPGEMIVTDEIGEKFLELLPPRKNTALLLSGDSVADLRGQQYWTKKEKWEYVVIEKLGEEKPENSIHADDLTDEQKVEITIGSWSTEERKQAHEDHKEAILTQAAIMRSRLEISGEKQALEKSKCWHKEQLKKLEEMYK